MMLLAPAEHAELSQRLSRPSAPTTDADTGAGLRGSNEDGEKLPNGDTTTAPSENNTPLTPPDHHRP